jgi:hypothetical protein
VKLAGVRAGVILVLASLLQSCGGGGNGEGDGGGNSTPGPRLTVSTSSVSAGATPGELAPTFDVDIAVSNMPAEGLWTEGYYSTLGIERVEFTDTGGGGGTLHIVFRLPSAIINDTYEDLIEVHVCRAQGCAEEIRNSPRNIHVSYVVSGDGLTTATISDTTLEATADHREDSNPPDVKTTVTLSNMPPTGVITRWTESSPAIQWFSSIDVEEVRDYYLTFVPPSQLNPGTYNDSLALELCYDESCVQQVQGSPFRIDTRYNVTIGVEPDVTPLQSERQEALGHNVVDAELSAPLNAIVMVSSAPTNAIHVYDLATGSQHDQALASAPTSLSVAPDGLSAAVGHDGNISVVDLTQVGLQAAPAPLWLDISVNPIDVILDSLGHVLAISYQLDYDNLHVVDIATNSEQDTGFSSGYDNFRRDPSSDALYSADDSMPAGLRKWDLSSGTLANLYTDTYYGEQDSCGEVWFDAEGDTLITTCGRTFSSSANPADDLIFEGLLPLTESATYWDNGIRAISHSPADGQFVLIESSRHDCNPHITQSPCYTRLAYHEDVFLNRQAIYAIGPVIVDDRPYAHLGRFVFHGADGKKYLIGELENPPSAENSAWLSVIE